MGGGADLGGKSSREIRTTSHLREGTKTFHSPEYGGGVGTFLTIAPDALPLISDRSVMSYQIPLAQTRPSHPLLNSLLRSTHGQV